MASTAETNGGGLLGRWENVRTRPSMKRMVPCDAATAEHTRYEYLKPQHLPGTHVDDACNFVPGPDMNGTRFHRGFHRRHKADIQVDAPRLEMEQQRELQREAELDLRAQVTREMKDKHTFNIITGEGVGRESEFRAQGKRIVNPFGSMPATFAEHEKEAASRMKSSKHRYFDHNGPMTNDQRMKTLLNEGMTETKRGTSIIGYGTSQLPRNRSQSTGVADNYAHLRAMQPEPQYEQRSAGHSASQIVLG